MADLRAEQIMAAVVTKVTGLTTTKQNVGRTQVYDIAENELPFLQVFQGADQTIGDLGFQNMSFIDSDLNVTVGAHVKQSTGIESELNKIRKEVHVALLADITQGLGFVITTIPRGASVPSIDHGNQPIASMDINFTIRYRHSITDPSA